MFNGFKHKYVLKKQDSIEAMFWGGLNPIELIDFFDDRFLKFEMWHDYSGEVQYKSLDSSVVDPLKLTLRKNIYIIKDGHTFRTQLQELFEGLYERDRKSVV